MANKVKIMSRNMGKFQNNIGGIKKRLGKPKPGGVLDARQKIIQKKRRNVVDARDILARMAKTQDARSKLLKLREKSKTPTGNVRAIGNNILRKTDPNGKISLVTNKNRSPNNIKIKIQEQLGLIPTQRSTVSRPTKKIISKRPQKIDYEPPIIRKTIRNEYSPPVVSHYPYEHHNMYRWYSGVSPLIAPLEIRRPVIDMPVSRSMISDSSSGEWKSYNSKMRTPNGYIDLDAVDDEDMPMVSSIRPGMARVSSNVHSRLDSKPQGNSSHGILSQTKTKVVVPMGHRIVVSNLQSTVTQDDIRELFEDIGQLLVARLVRPGTAEVIYKNLKDAQKAVDTYHNRQLDGQPMKCLLVNKRPINNPTAPAIKANSDSNNYNALSSRKLPTTTSSSTKLVPDISTIHKVLFQRN